jgi:hypothetical protein
MKLRKQNHLVKENMEKQPDQKVGKTWNLSTLTSESWEKKRL